MSLARITSGVFAGSVRSSACAAGTTRNAPPVPVAVAWQPEPAQVLIEVVPFSWICSWARKIGLMHFWKYANDRCWPVTVPGLATVAGLSNGFDDAAAAKASAGVNALLRSGRPRRRAWGVHGEHPPFVNSLPAIQLAIVV